MEITTLEKNSYSTPYSYSPPPPPPPPAVAAAAGAALSNRPCAACKILRRRCVDKCLMAPYFPPSDPLRFTTAHRVFGANNIIKLLQELPESQRADAVSSMVYEANARVRDPVYGCAGAVYQLLKQVKELEVELAKTRAELINMQCQHATSEALICMRMSQLQDQDRYKNQHILQQQSFENNLNSVSGDGNLDPVFGPLWM